MTRTFGSGGRVLCCALLLALVSPALAASTRDKGAATGRSEKVALYVGPVAFMIYCGIAIDDEAVGRTLAAVGLQGTSIPAIKAQAEKLVPQLEKLNGPGKFDFCKTAKTIPVVQTWTVKP